MRAIAPPTREDLPPKGPQAPALRGEGIPLPANRAAAPRGSGGSRPSAVCETLHRRPWENTGRGGHARGDPAAGGAPAGEAEHREEHLPVEHRRVGSPGRSTQGGGEGVMHRTDGAAADPPGWPGCRLPGFGLPGAGIVPDPGSLHHCPAPALRTTAALRVRVSRFLWSCWRGVRLLPLPPPLYPPGSE